MKKLLFGMLILVSLTFTSCGSKLDLTACAEHKKNCPLAENCPEHPKCEAHESCAKDQECKTHPECVAFAKQK